MTDSLGDDSSALHGSSQLGSHGGAPNEAAAVNEGDGEALGHGVRWVKRIHTVRLIECICGDDLRDAYLRRDLKPANLGEGARGALEVGDRNSFWIQLCHTFNDRNKTFSVKRSKSCLAQAAFDALCNGEGLSAAPTDFKLTPDKAKDKWQDVTKDLSAKRSKFKQSGQGDCATDDIALEKANDPDCPQGVSEESSLTVFSCDFWNFCKLDPITYYAYERLYDHDLHKSTAKAMPKQAQASSSSGSAAALPARPSCRPDAADATSDRKGGKAVIASALKNLSVNIKQGMQAPVVISKSSNEQAIEYAQAVTSTERMKRDLITSCEEIMSKVDALDEDIKKARQNGSTPPAHKVKMLAVLQASLDRQMQRISSADDALQPVLPVPPSSKRRASFDDGREEEEWETYSDYARGGYAEEDGGHEEEDEELWATEGEQEGGDENASVCTEEEEEEEGEYQRSELPLAAVAAAGTAAAGTTPWLRPLTYSHSSFPRHRQYGDGERSIVGSVEDLEVDDEDLEVDRSPLRSMESAS